MVHDSPNLKKESTIDTLEPAYEPHRDSRSEPSRTFIKPGFGLVPQQPGKLWTVVGSSIAVTLFDARRRVGGMTHYSRPIRQPEYPSTAFYAAPAIVWLVRQFLQSGSEARHLEAQVYGGASSEDAPYFVPDLHHHNARVGLEILEKSGIMVSSMDVGGYRGRKIVFNTLTGESAVIKVSHIRDHDWYPQLETGDA
ncbi:MAG: chemotaxis protein CheD [Acidobacteriota bacterium]|nr:chemotaxis protein CheD [Acidobacteriota bacterium]